MRTKFLLPAVIILLFVQQQLAAQQRQDSLFLAVRDDRAFVQHKVRKNETLFSLAQQFNVPAIVLAQTNNVSFHETLVPGKMLYIPMGKYNLLKSAPAAGVHAAPLYYQVQHGEEWKSVIRSMDISEAALRQWNPGGFNAGTTLQTGWLLYEAPTGTAVSEEEAPASDKPLVLSLGTTRHQQDTVAVPPGEHEQMFNYQTTDGTDVDSLNGMVVFFKSQTSVSLGRLYAFSNDIPKGKVVKIVNPSNGKFAFARILGPMPGTKQYYNAKLGVDSRAKDELEIRDNKLWCRLFFKY